MSARSRITVIVVAAVVAVGIVVAAVLLLPRVWAEEPGAAPSSSGSPSTPATASSSPPAEPLATPTPLPSTPGSPSAAPDRAPVTVVLAAWQATAAGIEASSFVQGVVEEGGTCVLRARLGDTLREVRGPATPTGQNVSCGFLTVPLAELTAGEWEIWFDYSSDASAGTSDAVTVTVDKEQ